MNIVISQPMFLPWLGLFEQVRLSDIFIHYDDVQLPQGRNFISRVQIKTPSGSEWLTAPIDRNLSGDQINSCWLFAQQDWREKHLKTIRHCYARAPFYKLMYEILSEIYSFPSNNLAEFNENAIEILGAWLGLNPTYVKSSQLGVDGTSTQRLVDICKQFKATNYITGLGALDYIEYEKFETNGINVQYMDYRKCSYQQLHGDFTPYVTILDAISICGQDTKKLLCSNSIYWKDFINGNY